MNFKSIDRRFTRKHLELYRDFESVNRHSWGSHFPFDTVTTPLEKYAWSVTRVVDRKIELISGIDIVVYLLEWTPHNGRTFTKYVLYVHILYITDSIIKKLYNQKFMGHRRGYGLQ